MPGRTVVELAPSPKTCGYHITPCAIERNLDSLLECRPLDVKRTARAQRWHWQKSWGLDLPGMEAAEAMALYIKKDAMQAHLSSCFLEALNWKDNPLLAGIEVVCKGPEVRLPPGISFRGKGGKIGHAVRVLSWQDDPSTYRKTAIGPLSNRSTLIQPNPPRRE